MPHRDERDDYVGLLGNNQQAFDRFFNEFFPRLYRFVLTRVAGNHDAAQELCQQTLIRGIQRFSSYRGEAALFTWLCQIARHGISDWWTRQNADAQRLVFIEDDALVRAAVETLRTPARQQPERARLDAEVSRLVQVALDQLPVHYGTVLEWKYLDGLSVAEVAQRLDQPFLATQSLLVRARDAFREVFAVLAGPELAPMLAGTRGSGFDE